MAPKAAYQRVSPPIRPVCGRRTFVEGGHGLARIPVYDAMPKIQQGTLVSVLNDYSLKDINVYGVFPPGGADSKKLRLLIDYLKAYFIKPSLIN